MNTIPVKDLPKAFTLSQFDGKRITLGDKLTPTGKNGSSLGELLAPEQGPIWIPSHVIDRIDGTIAGTYEVYSFDTDFGRPGYGIRNVE